MAAPERAPVTQTPEFKAALDAMQARFDAQLAEMTARFAAAPPAGDGAIQLADRLSVQLAKLTGQGIGLHYTDPEIVVRRQKADKEMRELLAELRERREEPVYALVGQTVMKLGAVGYALIEPYYRDANKKRQQTEINSYMPPNLAMRPANAAAERVWALFCASIGRNATGEDEDVEEFELTQAGATIRKGVRPPRAPSDADLDDAETIRIVRGDDPMKRKVQVFTGMAAIEMAERA